MILSMIRGFFVVLVGTALLPLVNDYSGILAKILALGIAIAAINVAYNGMRKEFFDDESLWESIKDLYYKLTKKEKPKPKKKKKQDLIGFKQFDRWVSGDVLTLTFGGVMICSTIFFLGAIDIKYDIGLTFENEIESKMIKVGEVVGDSLTFLLQNIYHKGQENPEIFFWGHILIIVLFIYNLARPVEEHDEIKEED